MASRYYTGRGDDGSTGMLTPVRVQKDNPVIEAIGSLDELNSYIGISMFYARNELVSRELGIIQNDLFIIGVELARMGSAARSDVELGEGAVARLEEAIASFGAKTPELKKFVMPGGCEGAVHLQYARSLARKAERRVVTAAKKAHANKAINAYLNRLSSLLFVMALYLNCVNGIEERNPAY